MVQQDLVEEDGQVGAGEEDVEETDDGGQQVRPPPVLLVELSQVSAVQEYDWEEPDHGYLGSGQMLKLQLH